MINSTKFVNNYTSLCHKTNLFGKLYPNDRKRTFRVLIMLLTNKVTCTIMSKLYSIAVIGVGTRVQNNCIPRTSRETNYSFYLKMSLRLSIILLSDIFLKVASQKCNTITKTTSFFKTVPTVVIGTMSTQSWLIMYHLA